MKRAGALAGMLMVACVSESHGGSVRIGGAIGYRASAVNVDRERPVDLDPDLADARGLAGFAEVVAGDALHVRGLYQRDDHDVRGTGTVAEMEQALLFLLLAPGAKLSDSLAARVLIGPGVGYTDVDLDPAIGIAARNGPTIAATLAAELVWKDSVFVGAMTWTSVFGEAGDTLGTSDSAMVYAGVRF